MKKVTRILCLMAAFAMCLSLCGCGMLDDLRAMRATMTAEGNIKLYDGTEYKYLPASDGVSPTFYQFNEVYVVEEDLPLLLITFSENYLDKSDDGLFLKTYTEDVDGYYREVYYCRTDIYDLVLDRVQNGPTFEQCFYFYNNYYEDNEGKYTLTPAQWDMLEQIVATQNPQKLQKALSENCEHWADLRICTADGMFSADTFDLCIYRDVCYVMDYENDLQYTVPAEMTAEMKKIMEKQIEADLSWEEW